MSTAPLRPAGAHARVVGLGAGGHARVVLEAIALTGGYEVYALLDARPDLHGTTVFDVPVFGGDDLLPTLIDRGVTSFFVGVGSVGDQTSRVRLFEKATVNGLHPVAVVHPSAVLSSSALIGGGVTVLAGAVINSAASLGRNVLVNTGAIVEHDCAIGDHVHIASGARLSSTVHVGVGAHIGAGATVRQCVTVGEGAVVAIGAAVVRDVEPFTVVGGVPARVLRHRENGGRDWP